MLPKRRFWPRTLEKCVENLHFINQRNYMLPERRFGKDEQKMKCGFSIEFFNESQPKSSTREIEKSFENPHFIFVPPSQIFVRESGGLNGTRQPVTVQPTHVGKNIREKQASKQPHRIGSHVVSSACHFHLVSYYDTSTCYSSCYHHRVTRVSSTDDSTFNTSGMHTLQHGKPMMTASLCEFDRHIIMLSPSCEF